MLTKLTIRNFKRFEDVTVDLGQSVVFVGPNNSGKTTALQALALWDAGLRAWLAKRGADAEDKKTPRKRPGVAVNRRELIALPIPAANLLWKDTRTRNVMRDDAGKQRTQNIRIDILVEGVTRGAQWRCGLEFDYANEESFYCRPLRLDESREPERMPVPELAQRMRIAYLPPMSGLADREYRKEIGEVGVLIGQGQTAQVLRNLCYRIYSAPELHPSWDGLTGRVRELFGVDLLPPTYYPERSEITMAYREVGGQTLDLSCSGRGLQQTLLLLAHLYSNPGSVLLLDEPDAHLEILRQRQTFNLLSDVAESMESQVVAASHSEVVLNEAATRGQVVAFVGSPHSLADRGSQVLKSLKDVGFEDYYQAEQTGWVLYLEDATDLAILKEFADRLDHPAAAVLERPFVHYVCCNVPAKAREHFHALREAVPDLRGLLVFDRLDRELQEAAGLRELCWRRREIENYIATRGTLLAWAAQQGAREVEGQPGELFASAESRRWTEAMEAALGELEAALRTLDRPGMTPWSDDIKASDDFLDPLFRNVSKRLGQPLVLRKSDYHKLVRALEPNEIDQEVAAKLDAVGEAARGNPVGSTPVGGPYM